MRDRLLKNFWRTACSSLRGKAMNEIYFCKGKYYTEYSDAVSGVPSFERGRVASPFLRKIGSALKYRSFLEASHW